MECPICKTAARELENGLYWCDSCGLGEHSKTLQMKWNPIKYNPWQTLWLVVWNISEYFQLSLGRIAPWVFQQMTGCKKIRLTESEG